jgi:hypothetical protein
MRLILLAIIPISVWIFPGCEPARSDLMIELADTTYVKQLPRLADTMHMVEPLQSPMAQALGAATGADYHFTTQNRRLRIWYGPTGQLVAMEETKSGVMVDSVAFHPNGQRMFSFTFNDQGVADGPVRYYYPDGRVKSDGRYVQGIKTGIWREFEPSGRLVKTHEYDRYGQKIR